MIVVVAVVVALSGDGAKAFVCVNDTMAIVDVNADFMMDIVVFYMFIFVCNVCGENAIVCVCSTVAAVKLLSKRTIEKNHHNAVPSWLTKNVRRGGGLKSEIRNNTIRIVLQRFFQVPIFPSHKFSHLR